MEALAEVYDPHLPVSVVDLGFIYDVRVEGGRVEVDMTLTMPGCPMHASITRQVEERIRELEGVEEAAVKLVWDPPWSPQRISEEARMKLGYTG